MTYTYFLQMPDDSVRIIVGVNAWVDGNGCLTIDRGRDGSTSYDRGTWQGCGKRELLGRDFRPE